MRVDIFLKYMHLCKELGVSPCYEGLTHFKMAFK